MFKFYILSLFILFLKLNDSNSKTCTRVVRYIEKVRVPVTSTRNETKFVTQNIPKTRVRNGCCRGYVLKNRNCEPVCNFVCENSICTAPNICTCNAGYKLFTLTRCIPECKNCDHGVCIGPDVCQCISNYEKSENGTCQPICENDCINGYCSAPNICSCKQGYYLVEETNESSAKCEPHCGKECKNGYCSAPEQCTCKTGYKMNSHNVCEPFCSNGCNNGVCIGPEECVCLPNFKNINDTVCAPHCEEDCINGDCLEPMKCTCRAGYELDSSNPYLCRAMCENCEFGDCVAPNVCQCHEGYEYDIFFKSCYPTTPFYEDFVSTTLFADYLDYDSTNLNDMTTTTESYLTDSFDNLKIMDDSTTTTSTTENVLMNFNFNYESTSVAEYDSTVSSSSTTESTSTTTYKNMMNNINEICNIPCTNGFCVKNKCECPRDYKLNPDNETECIKDELIKIYEKQSDKLAALPYVVLILIIIVLVVVVGVFYYKKCFQAKSYKTKESGYGVEYVSSPEEKTSMI